MALNELHILSCTIVLLRTISDNNAEFELNVQAGANLGLGRLGSCLGR